MANIISEKPPVSPGGRCRRRLDHTIMHQAIRVKLKDCRKTAMGPSKANSLQQKTANSKPLIKSTFIFRKMWSSQSC